MKKFLDEDFLLNSKTAVTLYNGFASRMPIFDYHCHISPKEIAEDKKYENITQLWLNGDHYKWRAMRANGVEEKYITGGASDWEKFEKWAETLPYCIGNPLYQWSHLELKRYFGVEELLNAGTARDIWNKCNAVITSGDFSTRKIIVKSNVKVICTTDNPVDSLEYHKALSKDDTFKVKVLPSFRPDVFVNIDKPDFISWLEKLSGITGIKINSLQSFTEAIKNRVEIFHKAGCRLADHALDPITFENATDEEASVIFKKALGGSILTTDETAKYKTWLLLTLGREYARHNWVMQYHIGTIRNVNSRMMRAVGPDTGFDAAGDYSYGPALAKMLDALDKTNELPKTILYSLNPNDFEMLFTIGSCFNIGGVPGKIQLGSAWWFNDQKDGMTRQLKAYANLGLLRRFVGMLTDSRSFISYTRHEYFRRLLCNFLGELAENGEIPADIDLLGNMVQDICYNNAVRYFNFE